MVEDKLNGLRNCKKCNRVFSSSDGSTLCSRCNVDTDDGFTKVREYIYNNPTSSIKDVGDGTGVDSEAILKWIRDGKIVLGERANISFCERCGVPIDGGRFCFKCVHEISTGLKSGFEEKNNKQHIGMHIKDSGKK